MEQLIISLVSGAIGGNVAGGVMKNLSLGTLGNSVAGIVGGGLGGQILGMLGAGGMAAAAGGGGMDIGAIVGQLASGGVGGGVLMAFICIVKNMMYKIWDPESVFIGEGPICDVQKQTGASAHARVLL